MKGEIHVQTIIPNKLSSNDEIRVLSPSTALQRVNSSADNKETELYFEQLGYRITYSDHIEEMDNMLSSSIQSRVEDLHMAFSDPDVKVILTSIGGYNSNELLPYLDYDLIRTNPKILCGYSDITALQNAIFAKTGLVCYSGPAYSSFKMKELQDYQTSHWLSALQNTSYTLNSSEFWSSDPWFLTGHPRNLHINEWGVYSEGEAQGISIVGNLNTFNLLQGTEYMPQVDHPILFIESAEENNAFDFARNLASLLQVYKQPKAILIGRFPIESETTLEQLLFILDKHPKLKKILVMYNVNFGHAQPIFTFPIGGRVKVDTNLKSIKVIEG
ncbi:S66 peptidase family protein [Aerococcaceae bacterium WGS1372]